MSIRNTLLERIASRLSHGAVPVDGTYWVESPQAIQARASTEQTHVTRPTPPRPNGSQACG